MSFIMNYLVIAGGIVLGIIAVLIVVIKKKQEKKKQELMYQRPRTTSVSEEAYYQPEDRSMAPVAYGSTTYGTNTYGQNGYGQADVVQPSYGTQAAPANANPLYGTQVTQTSANPLYGTQATDGLSAEFLKRSEEERKQRELASQVKPVQQNMNPLYGSVPVQPDKK